MLKFLCNISIYLLAALAIVCIVLSAYAGGVKAQLQVPSSEKKYRAFLDRGGFAIDNEPEIQCWRDQQLEVLSKTVRDQSRLSRALEGGDVQESLWRVISDMEAMKWRAPQSQRWAIGFNQVVGFCLIMLLVCVLPRLFRPRLRPGHCNRCGYDLFRNTSGCCPECGERIRGVTEGTGRGSATDKGLGINSGELRPAIVDFKRLYQWWFVMPPMILSGRHSRAPIPHISVVSSPIRRRLLTPSALSLVLFALVMFMWIRSNTQRDAQRFAWHGHALAIASESGRIGIDNKPEMEDFEREVLDEMRTEEAERLAEQKVIEALAEKGDALLRHDRDTSFFQHQAPYAPVEFRHSMPYWIPAAVVAILPCLRTLNLYRRRTRAAEAAERG